MDDELAAFVRARYQHLLRRAYLMTGSRTAAEDLVQEALARCCSAWRHRMVDQPDAYAQRVMVNLLISRSRLRRFREDAVQAMPEATAPETSDDASARHAERDAVWRALLLTPPRQRAVLVLRFYEDMAEAEIADCLQISVGTVRSQTFKGLAKLRQLGVGSTATEDVR